MTMPEIASRIVRAAEGGLLVYVAEDDEAFRALVVEVLRADGHEVMEASTGATLLFTLAVNGLREPGGPDRSLVICDVRMPACDGLAVLRNMREHGARVPRFLFMTAFPSAEVCEDARQLGALGVLAKPFELAELRAICRQVQDARGA
jgi:CheY-like chemotaxis protein